MLYPWARDDLLEETSIYTTGLKLQELRDSPALSKTNKNWVKVQLCKEGETICADESSDNDGPFCFMYDTLFIKLGLRLPLEMFEKEIIALMNVYTLIVRLLSRCLVFYVITLAFNLCRMCFFFYFFEFRSSNRQLWASLNNVKGLLTFFQSSYKNFKGRFVKI